MTEPQNRLTQPHSAQTTPREAPTSKDRLIGALLHEDSLTKARHYRWRDLMASDGQWLRRQIPVILLVVLGIVLYITNRYQAQKDTIRLVQLQNELKDVKFRVLTRSSELTLKTRQSELENRLRALGDTTLTTGGGAPFVIEADKPE